MPSQLEFAQLSLRAYAASQANRTPRPADWIELEWTPDQISGFSAGIYQKGNEIVIAYAGTNERRIADFGLANAPLFTGLVPSAQAIEAMLLYLTVKREYPTAQITFTGHSLGGGLASMMAVFFDRPAVVFDAAPFEKGALNWYGFYADVVGLAGFSDPALDDYRANAPMAFSQREARVTNTFTAGEFLDYLRTPSTEIGTSNPPIDVGSPIGASPIDRHSMVLLASMLTSTPFAEAVRAKPALLSMLFDKSLYYRPETFTERDWLRYVYGSQVDANAPAPLLDRFAADLQRIDTNAGLTAQSAIQRALIAAAMDYYYYKDRLAATQLFTVSGGALHFNFGDVAVPQLWLTGPRLLAAALDPGAPGNPILSLDEWSAVGVKLSTQAAWHVQTGSGAMTWTASAAAYDTAIGGADADSLSGGEGDDILIGAGGADTLNGGSGADTLFGGAGNDVLAGGLGNDNLDGGTGDDLYLYNQGEGRDVITDGAGTDTLRFGAGITLDSVAARTITVNGQSKVYIAVLGTDGTELQDQGVELAATGGVERFQFADGTPATLADLMVTPRTLNGTRSNDTLTGDRRDDTILADRGDDIVHARWGNDVVYGDSGNDILFGEGGNDTLYGESGADELWGGAGDDVLDGSSGNDQLVGGAGNDTLLGGVNDDLLDGGSGADTLVGDSGEDQLFGGAGNDTLDGGTNADLLAAGDGDDVIHAGTAGGVNVVVAGAGNDAIDAGTDRDFIDAGSGDDTIVTDTSSDFIAAGRGNDTINTGANNDLIAFNRGDGADLVVGSGWDRDVLSVGGGIRYADLSLRKSGDDLVVDLGQGDSIAFQGWYTSNDRRSIDTLQVVTVGGDYDTASTDRMKNRKAVSFDFAALANRFDQLRASNPSLTSWAVAGELNNYFKARSDTSAIGGDIAYRYATTGSGGSGSYGDLDWLAIRTRMGEKQWMDWQALTASTAVNPWTALQAGLSLVADQTVGLPSPITPVAPPTADELAFAALNASATKPSWLGNAPAPLLP